MRSGATTFALLGLLSLATACKKTGEGEYQVKVPDVDVKSDSATIRTPSVDVVKDTVVVPKVKVRPPGDTTR
jgi:hypothetical protein